MQDQQESRERKKGHLAFREAIANLFSLILRQNLGFHLLALYLLFVLPILGAGIYFDVRAGQRLRDDVAAADLSLAQAIALETDALLLKAQQAVVEFAQMPTVINSDLAAMEEAFSTASAARQDINLFYRLDADGMMVFHYPTEPGSTVGVDFSFRDYFKEARVSKGPVFSKGRISPTTQRPVATVVMPVRRPDGSFDGVVATNLELQRLTQTLVGIGREQGSQRGLQVVMVDAVGQVIADSQPEAELLRVVLDQLPGARQALAGKVRSFPARDEGGHEWLYAQDDLIMQVQQVHKRFGGLHALSDVTFDVPQGEILDLLDFVGLAVRRDALAASLNVAQKKRLELARALAARPYLLLLDEVLAGLNPTEIAEMVEVVRQIRDQGVTILIIEHVMHALMNVSDRVIVLDYGEQIAEGAPEEVANDPKVIEAYLGNPELADKLMQLS